MPSFLEQYEHPKYTRLKIQLRQRSKFYHAAFLDGRKVQTSLKADALETAFKLGEGWYKRLLRASITDERRHPIDKLATDPTMGEVFRSVRLTLPPHKRPYHDTKWGAVGPSWQAVVVTDVTTKLFRDFYARRRRYKTQSGEAPSNATLRKDAILLRLILTCSRLQPPLCRSTLIARPCVTADYLSSTWRSPLGRRLSHRNCAPELR